MGVYLRPGVFSREIDLSEIVPALATSVGAIVGAAKKGPVNTRTYISSDKDYIQTFGYPDPQVSYLGYSALAFLKQSNSLWVVRVANGALYSGVVINKAGSASDTTTFVIGASTYDPFDYFPNLETEDTGDGSTTTFAFTLGSPVVTESVVILNDAGDEIGTDDGAGAIVDSGGGDISTGTVDYTTGALSITYSTAYPANDTMTIQYEQDAYQDALFVVVAANQGVWGNDLKVEITDVNAAEYTFVLNVYETVNGVDIFRESFEVSRKNQLDGYGRQLYLEDKINNQSQYIRVVDNLTELDTVLPPTAGVDLVSLEEGDDGLAVSSGQVATGWDLFANVDDVKVNLLINGGYTTFAVQDKIREIAEDRHDCMGILDLPSTDQEASAAVSWRTTPGEGNFNSSYIACYANDYKVYDNHSDIVLYVPSSGYVAAQYAYNDFQREAWYAPAGLNRGLVNVLDVRYNYDAGEQDLLYSNGINFTRVFPGKGIAVWGQKTMQAKASATDRVNVRRLLLVVRTAVSSMLWTSVFELNNDFTRTRIKEAIDSYMQTVQAKNGVYAFQVVCDESNNTPAVIDANEMHVDIYMQPQKAAEFIQLQTIITRTGVNFAELIATGGNF